MRRGDVKIEIKYKYSPKLPDNIKIDKKFILQRANESGIEDEFLISGKTLYWINKGNLIKSISTASEIIQCIWCNFNETFSRKKINEEEEGGEDLKKSVKKEKKENKKKEYMNYLAILHNDGLLLHSMEGKILNLNLPCNISSIWALPTGIILEREKSESEKIKKNKKKKEENKKDTPSHFSLLNPLEEIKPISYLSKNESQSKEKAGNSKGREWNKSKLNESSWVEEISALFEEEKEYMNNENYKIIFTSIHLPLIIFYNLNSNKNVFFLIHKRKYIKEPRSYEEAQKFAILRAQFNQEKRKLNSLQFDAAPSDDPGRFPNSNSNETHLNDSMFSNYSLLNESSTLFDSKLHVNHFHPLFSNKFEFSINENENLQSEVYLQWIYDDLPCFSISNSLSDAGNTQDALPYCFLSFTRSNDILLCIFIKSLELLRFYSISCESGRFSGEKEAPESVGRVCDEPPLSKRKENIKKKAGRYRIEYKYELNAIKSALPIQSCKLEKISVENKAKGFLISEYPPCANGISFGTPFLPEFPYFTHSRFQYFEKLHRNDILLLKSDNRLYLFNFYNQLSTCSLSNQIITQLNLLPPSLNVSLPSNAPLLHDQLNIRALSDPIGNRFSIRLQFPLFPTSSLLSESLSKMMIYLNNEEFNLFYSYLLKEFYALHPDNQSQAPSSSPSSSFLPLSFPSEWDCFLHCFWKIIFSYAHWKNDAFAKAVDRLIPSSSNADLLGKEKGAGEEEDSDEEWEYLLSSKYNRDTIMKHQIVLNAPSEHLLASTSRSNSTSTSNSNNSNSHGEINGKYEFEWIDKSEFKYDFIIQKIQVIHEIFHLQFQCRKLDVIQWNDDALHLLTILIPLSHLLSFQQYSHYYQRQFYSIHPSSTATTPSSSSPSIRYSQFMNRKWNDKEKEVVDELIRSISPFRHPEYDHSIFDVYTWIENEIYLYCKHQGYVSGPSPKQEAKSSHIGYQNSKENGMVYSIAHELRDKIALFPLLRKYCRIFHTLSAGDHLFFTIPFSSSPSPSPSSSPSIPTPTIHKKNMNKSELVGTGGVEALIDEDYGEYIEGITGTITDYAIALLATGVRFPLLMKQCSWQEEEEENKLNKLSNEEKMISIMAEEGIHLKEINKLPRGISLPIKMIQIKIRKNPSSEFKYEEYLLLSREDMAIQYELYNHNNDNHYHSNLHYIYKRLPPPPPIPIQNHSTALSVAGAPGNASGGGITSGTGSTSGGGSSNDENNKSYIVEGTLTYDPVCKLLFSKDIRINELRRILSTSIQQVINIKQNTGMTESEIMNEQQEYLKRLSQRTMSVPVGRGMFTLSSVSLVTSDQIIVPKLEYSGRIKDTKIVQTLNIPNNEGQGNNAAGNNGNGNSPSSNGEYDQWPQFHNGVSTALRIIKSNDNTNHYMNILNLLNNNKPKSPTDSHAGFLMGLGLQANLHSIKLPKVFNYLKDSHSLTSIGLLLGLSVNRIQSMDIRYYLLF